MKDRDWILLGLLFWWWLTRQAAAEVRIPGEEIPQECWYADGSMFTQPVNAGPCPERNDNGFSLVV